MRSLITVTALAVSTFLATVPAFADAEHKPMFPMPAADFRQKVDAREAKARAHMERRASKLGADEAQALRARFDAGVATIHAEVDKATADGTVTKEEAHAVRRIVREVRGHGHRKDAPPPAR